MAFSNQMLFLDVFGTNFNFTIFGQSKFHTKLGFILSLFFYLIGVVFFVVFGMDLFERKNPRIISEQLRPENLTLYYPDQKSFTYAWRIEDNNANMVNLTDKLEYAILYYEYKRDEAGNLQIATLKNIPVEKCTEENAPDPEFKKHRNISNWYCIDFKKYNISLGGDWDGEFINYVLISINFCKTEDFFSVMKNCLSYDELNKLIKTTDLYYFSVQTPKFYFDANNLDNPLRYTYKYSYNTLDPLMFKTQRIYLKTAYLDDDQNLLLSGSQLSNKTVFDSEIMGMDLRAESAFKNPTNPFIFNNVLYMNSGGDKFSRRYMKLQDLAATIGGFMQLVLIVGKIISSHYNAYQRNVSLCNEIFSFEETEKEGDQFLVTNFGIDETRKNELETEKNELIKISKNLSSGIVLIRESTLKGKSINQSIQGEENKRDLIMMENLKKEEERKLRKEPFSPKCSSFIKKYLCKKELSSSELNVINAYDLARSFIQKSLDIKAYIDLSSNLEKLITFSFNEYQAYALRFFEKQNLYNSLLDKGLERERKKYATINPLTEAEEKGNKDKKDEKMNLDRVALKKKLAVIKYFSQRIKDKTVDAIDKELYENLELHLKTLIKQELTVT